MKKEYKEIRKINADSLQSLCISKRWYTRGDNAAYNHLLYDLADGELHIHVVEPFDQDDTEWYILTKEKFLNGLAKYLKEPKYSDCLEFVNHELRIDTCYIDADVADTIIQYALFGEVVYG